MELREFVTSTLVDILDGVAEAHKETKHGEIAPNHNSSGTAMNSGISNVQTIDFEVSVKADESEGSKGKLRVVAAIIGTNIQGQSSQSSTSVATLNFRIPVRFNPAEKP